MLQRWLWQHGLDKRLSHKCRLRINRICNLLASALSGLALLLILAFAPDIAIVRVDNDERRTALLVSWKGLEWADLESTDHAVLSHIYAALNGGSTLVLSPAKVGWLTVPVAAFATPVKVAAASTVAIPVNTALPLPAVPPKVCAGIVPAYPVKDGTPEGQVMMPAALELAIACGTDAGQEMMPAALELPMACGTDAGQEMTPDAVAVLDSITTPEFVTSATKTLVTVTRTSGTRLTAPAPKVPVGRKRNTVLSVWMIGSS